jgi:hypothetical protein
MNLVARVKPKDPFAIFAAFVLFVLFSDPPSR